MRPFDSKGNFHCSAEAVTRLAIRGAGLTVFSSGIGLLIQIVATVVLARLLTPGDFGLVTMVTTFSLLFVNFGLNGFTESVLQRETLEEGLASNLFWINIGLGLVLTLAFAGAGSLLSRFYQNPLVANVAAGISLSIIATSVSVLHLALLKRALRFSTVSINDVVAAVVSVVVSISLAWAGWGYWALVAGVVARPISVSVGAWWLCRWLPSRPQRVAGTASAVGFAAHVYGRFTVNYFARNIDNLLVGWRFGALSLGFYKKAYDLFALSAGQLTSPLTNVAVSAMSRLNTRSAQYRQHLLSALSVLAFIGMGLSAELTLVGKSLIRLLLGPGWETAGRIFTFFGPGIGAMLLYHVNGWIHLSLGKANRWLRWGFVEVGVTCLLFLLSLRWGPEGIAAAWTASFWILTLPALWYAGKPIDLGIKPVIGAVWKFLVAAVLAFSASAAILSRNSSWTGSAASTAELFLRIGRASLLFGALYLSGVMILHRGWGPLHQLIGLLREIVARDNDMSKAASVPEPAPAMTGRRSKYLVSILIPAYNAQDTIADTLRSALAQTWEPKEIIVVDDGSSDETVRIANRFESQGVRVVQQKNQGASTARNLAFSLSHGDYIQWLDADDILAPDKIAKQLETVETREDEKVLLSSAWGRFIYRYYRAEFMPTALWCDLSPVEWLVRKMGQNLYMQTASWLVHRDLTEAAGPWDTRLLSDDDGEYFCRVLLASNGVRFVSEAKVYYRGPGLAFRSLSYIGQSDRKLDAHWLSMRLHIDYLRSMEDTDRSRYACIRYLQTSLLFFYPEKADIVREAAQVARLLGGNLGTPALSWKYAWIKTVFGWHVGKVGQEILLRSRWSVEKLWDHAMFNLENLGQMDRALSKINCSKRLPIVVSAAEIAEAGVASSH